MPSEILAKLRAASKPDPALVTVTPKKVKGSSVLADLRKKRDEAVKKSQAPIVPVKPAATSASTSTPTKVSAGPRISLLQKAKDPTLRQATPEEITRSNDPVEQQRNRDIAASTPQARQLDLENNVPAPLNTFAKKTVPNLMGVGNKLVERADMLDEKKTGVNSKSTRAVGETLIKTTETISDFVNRLGKFGKTQKPGESARAAIDVGVGLFNLGAIPFIAGEEAVGAVPVVGTPAKKAVDKVFETTQKVGSYALGATYQGYYNAVTGKHLDPKDANLATVQEVGGLAAILLGAKAVHSASGA